jgi:hypothetical protein
MNWRTRFGLWLARDHLREHRIYSHIRHSRARGRADERYWMGRISALRLLDQEPKIVTLPGDDAR